MTLDERPQSSPLPPPEAPPPSPSPSEGASPLPRRKRGRPPLDPSGVPLTESYCLRLTVADAAALRAQCPARMTFSTYLRERLVEALTPSTLGELVVAALRRGDINQALRLALSPPERAPATIAEVEAAAQAGTAPPSAEHKHDPDADDYFPDDDGRGTEEGEAPPSDDDGLVEL